MSTTPTPCCAFVEAESVPHLLEYANEYAVSVEAGPELLVLTAGDQGPPGPPGQSSSVAFISTDPNNLIKSGTDSGLYAPDALPVDPLVFYLLARG